MNLTVKYVFVILMLTATSCKARKQGGETKDEGLHLVNDLSLLVDKLVSFYQLNLSQKQRTTFKENLEKTILATFEIACPNRSINGTGFFVSAKGDFVTNAHVLNIGEHRNCKIRTNSIRDNRVTKAKWLDVIFKIEDGMVSKYRFDTSFGRVLTAIKEQNPTIHNIGNIKTKEYLSDQYLPIANQDPPNGTLLFALGYPMETFRDGKMTIEKRKQWDQKHKDNCKKEPTALPDKYVAQLTSNEVSVGSKRQIEADLAKHYDQLLCEIGEKSRRVSLQTSVFQDYDKVPEEGSPLVIAAGNVEWQDRYLIATDGELLPGMSGSPLVDLTSGKVHGTNFATLGFFDGETEKYSMQHAWAGSQAAKKISPSLRLEIRTETIAYDNALNTAIAAVGEIQYQPCNLIGLNYPGLKCEGVNINPWLRAKSIQEACLPKSAMYRHDREAPKHTDRWDSIRLNQPINFADISVQVVSCADRYTQGVSGCCMAEDWNCLWDVSDPKQCTIENINKVCKADDKIQSVVLKPNQRCLSGP